MKDRVDKSMGTVTLMAKTLLKQNLQSPEDLPSVQLARNETAQIPQEVILRKTLASRCEYKKSRRTKSS
jgi:hypothetical protein